MTIALDVTVKRELVKDKAGRIRFRKFREVGYDHYLLRIYLDGKLDGIDFVNYELHPSFKVPIRTSNDRKDRFAITFWTYGEFDITVNLFCKNKEKKQLTFKLEYSDGLPAEDGAYVDESNKGPGYYA